MKFRIADKSCRTAFILVSIQYKGQSETELLIF